MNRHKNPTVAFMLSLIPGLGHLYMGRALKGVLLGGAFLGSLVMTLFLLSENIEEVAVATLIIAFLIWFGSLFDIVRTIAAGPPYPAHAEWGSPNHAGSRSYGPEQASERPYGPEAMPRHMERERPSEGEPPRYGSVPPQYPSGSVSDRHFTILLSFLPGLGHFQLGLMQRGLAFLALFFGLGVVTVFLTAMTNQDDFLVLLGGLPIIWLYGLFDCVQQLHRKQRGETLVDRTIFEDFQDGRESGKKNKTIAMLLSMFPGAGHMYLGLQKRGLQLMAAFLFSVYFMDALRLSLFLFLIPILWFYSFFDALQQISKSGREPLTDAPIVDWLVHRQRWIGIGLLGLGLYYLLDQVLLNMLDLWLPREVRSRVLNWYHTYFQTFIVSVLLIGGGIRLLWGGKKGKRGE
ncbi:hypothetical protein P9314_15825 [Paenibacillus validus]|uniref:hypothetical protein n=1 Tax=Paenibacillus TaxID=44249 RepID=UPI000FD7AECE|nr:MULTISPECIES: hypothetical protein [Paenibacillus]MED4602155.1 hypothetical protein [Paenibacillus validus]MED4607728.1 hypothetical protein [Paenibacillus validus]